MPKKDSWKTTKRRKTKKGKKGPGQETECYEYSRLPDDGELYIASLGSEISCASLKKETPYPDVRFGHSTTLFPAEGIENITPSESPQDTLKRSPEDDAFATPPKRCRLNDLPISECMIIENTKPEVKVELIDLTDDSPRITSMVCDPVRISFLENRLPAKMKTTHPANGKDVRIKVEPNEKTSEVNTDIGVAADMNYAITTNAEQNKASENNSDVNKSSNGDNVYIKFETSEKTCEINTDAGFLANMNAIEVNTEQNKASENNNEVTKFHVDLNKSINPSVDNRADIQVKTESSNVLNFNECTNEPLLDNCIKINAEQNNNFQENEPPRFRTTLLKYLNSNVKIDILEIANALSVFEVLTEKKQNVINIE